MKEVQVIAWCDFPHEQAVRAEVERNAAFDGEEPRYVDVCLPHAEQVDEMKKLFAAGVTLAKAKTAPRPATNGRRRSEPLPCPEPGCARTIRGRAGLGQHVRQQHKKYLRDYPNEGWLDSPAHTR